MTNWLWDRKLNISQAGEILKDPDHKDFGLIASLLFSRNNNPNEVFKKYIDPLVFCRFWSRIKREMRQNKWDEPRIIFWQAVYERLRDKYRQKGISFREEKKAVKSDLCEEVGKQIRRARKEQNLSQKALSKKAGISQQLISRIECGGENISLITLYKISVVLGKQIEISLR